MHKHYLLAGCSLALAVATGASPVLAQDAPATAPVASNGEDDRQLGDVVVTARRRAESLQMTPVAVTALNDAELSARNVTSLLDVANYTPNVVVGSQTSTGSQSGGFFIRGIGQDRSGITFDQGVGLYIDDVYYARSDNALLGIVDVDRIEVLRGPQGTLFGKNTIGGAIRYITKQPTDTLGGYVDATIGSFNRADIKASINVPLTENLFAKATFGSLTRDGYIREIAGDGRFGGDNTQVERLQLRANLAGDRVTIDLDGNHMHTKTNGRAFSIDFINPNASFLRALTTKTGAVYDNRYLSPNPYTIYGGRDSSYRYDGYGINGTVSVKLGDRFTLKSITAYMEADIHYINDYDGTALPVFDYTTDRKTNQFSQEFQLYGAAFADRLNFVAGLYYMREAPSDTTVTITANDAFYPTPRRVAQSQNVNSYAAYAQGTLKITGKLSTTLGIRYSKDEKSTTTHNFTTNLAGSGKGSWDDVSPRASVEYQWTPKIMTYISATKGFRSGGINVGLSARLNNVAQAGLIQSLIAYDPETVWTYEAGIRSDLFDVLRVNLTGFHTRYTSQQLTALDPVANIIFVQNVGTSHQQGIELETTLAPTRRLKLQGSFGYLDAKYDNLGTATGISVNSRVLRSPKFSYSLSAGYELPVGESTVAAHLDWSYRSSQTTTSTDSNTVLLAGYGLLNGRVNFFAPHKTWSLAAFATNLTNKVYYIGGVDFARRETLIGISQLDVGRPREFGLELKYTF
ncbi:MAG: TonB-dependent receptor [Pseudomonadota bacterium]